ncbi:heme ABC transporter ATP-binding protein [Vineibacter terrae]|uniref:heme ABC transporter ATP-binding protein n=1 Tax=Vineibacter terrae TaxID=2586908 RepID=UPI002E2F0624|nr:heme ABC transporter ATP-binding protein [Vineibacter terrae]HEX2890897.1 heme ABC transporter ATP-binding protein [Vineibacter terrae]
MTLTADAVSVHIGSATLLRAVSLAAQPGEVLGLLGPNGAGKSTLLSLLAGDRRPDSGIVRLHGRDPRRWPAEALARVRAVMTQSASVAFDFTVREVVELARMPHAGRSSAAEDRRIVAAALELADVTHLADRVYPSLSGGEKQRVQSARALAQLWTATDDAPCRFLMLDEPTASLDLRHQHGLLDAVRRFVSSGVGAIVVLHDINLAAAYCDRVALLDRGALIACGPTRETLCADRLAAMYGVSLAAIDDGLGGPHFVVRPPAAPAAP